MYNDLQQCRDKEEFPNYLLHTMQLPFEISRRLLSLMDPFPWSIASPYQ
jgi:hypothetical protein